MRRTPDEAEQERRPHTEQLLATLYEHRAVSALGADGGPWRGRHAILAALGRIGGPAAIQKAAAGLEAAAPPSTAAAVTLVRRLHGKPLTPKQEQRALAAAIDLLMQRDIARYRQLGIRPRSEMY